MLSALMAEPPPIDVIVPFPFPKYPLPSPPLWTLFGGPSESAPPGRLFFLTSNTSLPPLTSKGLFIFELALSTLRLVTCLRRIPQETHSLKGNYRSPLCARHGEVLRQGWHGGESWVTGSTGLSLCPVPRPANISCNTGSSAHTHTHTTQTPPKAIGSQSKSSPSSVSQPPGPTLWGSAAVGVSTAVFCVYILIYMVVFVLKHSLPPKASLPKRVACSLTQLDTSAHPRVVRPCPALCPCCPLRDACPHGVCCCSPTCPLRAGSGVSSASGSALQTSSAGRALSLP